MLPLATERACQMFTAEQYRAKAAEFRAFLTNTSRSPNETSEFRDLEQTYTPLKGQIARFLHNHKNDQQTSD